MGLRLLGSAGLAACIAAAGMAAERTAIVPYTIVDGRTIPESLTGLPGDPDAGRALFADPKVGCAACHDAPGVAVKQYDTARQRLSLHGVGQALSPGEIRLWLVDPRALAPETAMPAYYLAGQRQDPDDPLYNGPRLTASQIEDLVAFLTELDGTR